jgi:transcriptional regulator with XRE-family HTH domain
MTLDLQMIGEAIAGQRRALGLTQSELAALSHTSRATITALETCAQRELGFNKVMAILAALEIDLRITAANMNRPTLEDLQKDPPS